MSRFKMFALAQMMMAAIIGDRKKSDLDKKVELKNINRATGGALFMNAGSVYGPRPLNQRQKRKRWRQNPHIRKRAA